LAGRATLVAPPQLVIPAQAGIQQRHRPVSLSSARAELVTFVLYPAPRYWIPACAGMTLNEMSMWLGCAYKTQAIKKGR